MRLFLPILLPVLIAASTASAQTQIGGGTCSPSLVKGAYFYLLSGTATVNGRVVPYAELGSLVSDGAGKVTSGTSNASVNGVHQTISFTGTYTLGSNCAGVLTVLQNSAFLETLTFQVVDAGQNAIVALSATGVVAAGKAYRQTATSALSTPCSNASISGNYGYLLTGAVASGSISQSYADYGTLTSDGKGNINALSIVTNPPTTGTGTYSVTADCRGTGRVTSPAGTVNYLFAIVQDGKLALFFGMDAGYTIAGTTEPQFSAPQAAVVNAASFLPLRLVPGSIVSIFGTDLSEQEALATVLPLPRTLGTTQVLANGVSMPLFYVGPGQINAQIPAELSATAPVSLVVVNGTKSSNPVNVTLSAAAPGVFVYGANNQAVVQNPDGSINSDAHPAHPADVLVGYLTGGGPVDPLGSLGTGFAAPGAAKSTLQYSASLGTADLGVRYLGLAPTYVGLYQINFAVPVMPTGRYPLVVTVDGVASNGPIVSVQN